MMSVALRAAGLHLRNAEPAMMREFLVDVHSRAATASQTGAMTTRAEVIPPHVHVANTYMEYQYIFVLHHPPSIMYISFTFSPAVCCA